MQQKNDGQDNGQDKDDPFKKGDGSSQPLKRKQGKQKEVGDETANPLPDNSYSARQPSGDTTEANPQGESPVD